MLIELFEVVLKKYCGVKYINPSNSHRENLFDWNHKNYNALPEKLKSKTLRNFTKGKTNSSLNVGNGSNHSIIKDDKRRNTDSSFNNIKDTKDDTRGPVVTDEFGNSGKKNKNKDVHCQCFIF